MLNCIDTVINLSNRVCGIWLDVGEAWRRYRINNQITLGLRLIAGCYVCITGVLYCEPCFIFIVYRTE